MIKILVVTDNTLHREAIEAILRASECSALLNTASDAHRTLENLETSLQGGTSNCLRDGFDHCRAEQRPKGITLSIHDDGQIVFSWPDSRYSGYIERAATAEALLRAVRDTHQGELIVASQLISALVSRLAVLANKMAIHYPTSVPLTAREREILGLIGQGLPNKKIASRLGISYATAKNHVHHILEKLELKRRGDAVPYSDQA